MVTTPEIAEAARNWVDGNPSGDVQLDLAAYQFAVYNDPDVQRALELIKTRAVDLAGPGDEEQAWAAGAVSQLGATMAAELLLGRFTREIRLLSARKPS